MADAKFQLNRLGISESQWAKNDYPPLTWHIVLTTVNALMCYIAMVGWALSAQTGYIY